MKILGFKKFAEAVLKNAITLNEGNAVPYFILLELYFINNIKGNEN
jgi:hypothetical protein